MRDFDFIQNYVNWKGLENWKEFHCFLSLSAAAWT